LGASSDQSRRGARP